MSSGSAEIPKTMKGLRWGQLHLSETTVPSYRGACATYNKAILFALPLPPDLGHQSRR